jgi:type VI protein secretion system component VasF
LPDETLSARADEVAPVSKAEEKLEPLADFAKRPENMLPRAGDTLPEGGMEALALQWVDQMEAVRQSEAQENFSGNSVRSAEDDSGRTAP